MRRIRVIPVLLLQEGKLVKTEKFSKPKYVGDPINAVKIFNEKEVDEIVILDISASKKGKAPNFNQIKEIASESFMPLGYGGGVSQLSHVHELFQKCFVEKVIFNTAALTKPSIITETASAYGEQSVVVSIDVKTNFFGKSKIHSHASGKNTKEDLTAFVKRMESMGAGEIIINSVDRDGTFNGYDTELTRKVASAVTIPVIACGGANSLQNMKEVVSKGNASAVAAGSYFVFKMPHKAVLINYPTQKELIAELFNHFE